MVYLSDQQFHKAIAIIPAKLHRVQHGLSTW